MPQSRAVFETGRANSLNRRKNGNGLKRGTSFKLAVAKNRSARTPFKCKSRQRSAAIETKRGDGLNGRRKTNRAKRRTTRKCGIAKDRNVRTQLEGQSRQVLAGIETGRGNRVKRGRDTKTAQEHGRTRVGKIAPKNRKLDDAAIDADDTPHQGMFQDELHRKSDR
jgi:hypothetical protein